MIVTADLSDRIEVLEREVAVMKAIAGRVAMPPSLLALLWGVLIVAISAVVFVVRLDTRVGEMSRAIEVNQRSIMSHINEPWHAAAGEKYKAVDSRIDRMDNRIESLERK